MKSVFHVGLASVICLATSCSDSSSSDSPTPSDSTIGADGGTVTADSASVEVPEGALPTATRIVVAESDVAVDPPEGYVLVGPAIAFTPHGLSFDEPVTLTLPYDSSASALAVLRLDDEDDDSWDVINDGAFASGSATLEVTQFSIYAVAEESETPAGMGGASGASGNEGGAPGDAGGMGGASDSAGAPGAGGAPAGDGDLSYGCDNRDDPELPLCTDHFFPQLVVELAGVTAMCPDGSVLVDACDTTDAVIGCLATDVDGLPGVTVTNWFYAGTPEDIMNGVLCTQEGEEFVDPP